MPEQFQLPKKLPETIVNSLIRDKVFSITFIDVTGGQIFPYNHESNFMDYARYYYNGHRYGAACLVDSGDGGAINRIQAFFPGINYNGHSNVYEIIYDSNGNIYSISVHYGANIASTVVGESLLPVVLVNFVTEFIGHSKYSLVSLCRMMHQIFPDLEGSPTGTVVSEIDGGHITFALVDEGFVSVVISFDILYGTFPQSTQHIELDLLLTDALTTPNIEELESSEEGDSIGTPSGEDQGFVFLGFEDEFNLGGEVANPSAVLGSMSMMGCG